MDKYELISDRLRQEGGRGDIRIIMEAAEAIDDLRYQVMKNEAEKRKTYGWHMEDDCYECGKCGEEFTFIPQYVEDMESFISFLSELHYCPNCGARMEMIVP